MTGPCDAVWMAVTTPKVDYFRRTALSEVFYSSYTVPHQFGNLTLQSLGCCSDILFNQQTSSTKEPTKKQTQT